MAGLCKIMIVGNLGKDPEMRYTPNGKPVTTFSVAVNRRYGTGEGAEQREETEWFRVTAWNKLAETCNEFLSKGRKVFVEGRFQSRAWETQDGRKGTSLEITATDMILLDRPKTATLEEPGMEEAVEAEDLPF